MTLSPMPHALSLPPSLAAPHCLPAQIEFLLEVERLRGVHRHNLILSGARCENSAEHSWHVALYALAFAPLAPRGVDITRVMQMLLLHDIVEIDVGDHPVHQEVDWAAVVVAEEKAATRIFGLLPDGSQMLALWQEFESNQTPDARFAKALDWLQPLFQTACSATRPKDHLQICRDNLITGRARLLAKDWPEAHAAALALIEDPEAELPAGFAEPIAFVTEADQLKSVLRASKLLDLSRPENSAEHSWHIALFAWVLAEHSAAPVDLSRVLRMLVIHDLVEIDAGDMPIHAQQSPKARAALEAKEQAAAARLFGLLPQPQAQELLQLWQEFEAAESDDAHFAKAVDRVQPALLNLMSGGGSWDDYDVSFAQLETRVGGPVSRGAPALWDYLSRAMEPWFAARGRLS